MPTLVDTSMWIDHLRTNSPALHRLLDEELVVCHPLIIGDLACGNMKHQSEVLESLALLPPAGETVQTIQSYPTP